MCRYYGYLAHHLDRLGTTLQIFAVAAASGAFLSLLSEWDVEWLPSLATAAAAAIGALLAIKKYPEKAARSAELRRQLALQLREWEGLWSNVYEKDDEELANAWRDLTRRQEEIVKRAPFELPLAKCLARRSEREAY